MYRTGFSLEIDKCQVFINIAGAGQLEVDTTKALILAALHPLIEESLDSEK